MARDPSFPFYASDWLGSTRVAMMDAHQERGYLRLLCHMWSTPDCALPDNDELLARLSLMNERWLNGGSSLVRECLVPHPHKAGFVTNMKLLEVRTERDRYFEQQRLRGIESGKSRREAAKVPKSNAGSTAASRKTKEVYDNETRSFSEPKTNSPFPSPVSSDPSDPSNRSDGSANFNAHGHANGCDTASDSSDHEDQQGAERTRDASDGEQPIDAIPELIAAASGTIGKLFEYLDPPDGYLCWKAAVLVQAGYLSEASVISAAHGARLTGRSPIKVFRTAMRETCKQFDALIGRVKFPRGHDFRPPAQSQPKLQFNGASRCPEEHAKAALARTGPQPIAKILRRGTGEVRAAP